MSDLHLGEGGVPLEGADWTVMSSVHRADPLLAFVLLVAGEDVSPLCAHHELGRDGPLVLQDGGPLLPLLLQGEDVRGLAQLTDVPPEDLGAVYQCL